MTSLAEKSTSPLPLFFPLLHRSGKIQIHSSAFDETLIFRLKSLLPIPRRLSLAWLALAADLLSSVLSSAAALLSGASTTSAADRAALSAHLDASLALLDALNAASAQIDRLSRSRLHLRLALHLLSSETPPSTGSVRRARESLREWSESRSAPRVGSDLVLRRLATSDLPPRGKISTVRRAIYAVEAISGLIASALLGGELAVASASGEFKWADAFNGVVTMVKGMGGVGSAAEVAAVEENVGELTEVIDGEEEGRAERLRKTVGMMERRMQDMTEGLERLGDAVNGAFHAALSARNLALQSFRVGPKKCK